VSILCELETGDGYGEALSGTRGREGYLYRAHYHYAIGLHELRRYIRYRRVSSKAKWHLQEPGEAWETLKEGEWPDFVLRAASSNLGDMAEGLLGRLSLLEMCCGSCLGSLAVMRNVSSEERGYEKQIARWFEGKPAGGDVVLGRGDAWVRLPSVDALFGQWPSASDARAEGPLMLGFGRPVSSGLRLLLYTELATAAGRYLEAGGYREDAAWEALRVGESCAQLILWQRILKTLGELGEESSAERTGACTFWALIGQISAEGLKRAADLFKLARDVGRGDGMRGVQDGATGLAPALPVRLVACTALLRVLCEEDSGGRSPIEPARGAVDEVVETVLGREAKKEGVDGALTALEEAVRSCSFPMVERMIGLKVLIEGDLALGRLKGDHLAAWLIELREWRELYSAPLHFTPLQSGVTFAWAALACPGLNLKGTDVGEVMRQEAVRDLETSQQMYTLRRAFYEAISGLYYLYDEFNDRVMHYNHAIQMAGSDIAAVLLRKLGEGPGSGKEPMLEGSPRPRRDMTEGERNGGCPRGSRARRRSRGVGKSRKG
jgi:hypothetical protein